LLVEDWLLLQTAERGEVDLAQRFGLQKRTSENGRSRQGSNRPSKYIVISAMTADASLLKAIDLLTHFRKPSSGCHIA